MRIGVLGYNSNLTKEALWYIAQNDEDAQIISISTKKAVMSDGTFYELVKIDAEDRGTRFDQIILVDDYRWEILNTQKELVDDFKFYRLRASCVPEDFQILKYEW